MRKLLLVLVLFNCGCAAASTLAIRTAIEHHVVVETDVTYGAGVILQRGLVLTSAHLAMESQNLTVNGKEARIIFFNPKADLMVLSTITKDVGDLRYSSGIWLAEDVVSIGNPNMIVGVLSTGKVVKIGEREFYIDTLAMPGFSGGGVYNSRGQLIGINSAMLGAHVGGSYLLIVVPVGDFLDTVLLRLSDR